MLRRLCSLPEGEVGSVLGGGPGARLAPLQEAWRGALSWGWRPARLSWSLWKEVPVGGLEPAWGQGCRRP